MGLTPGENAAAAQDPDATDEAGAPATDGHHPARHQHPGHPGTPHRWSHHRARRPPRCRPARWPTPSSPPAPRTRAEATVILAQYNDDGEEIARYELGPAAMTGEALDGAQAVLDPALQPVDGHPAVQVGQPRHRRPQRHRPGCVSRTPECPTGQLAIVLDEEVISAPSIEQPSFEADSIQISGSFTESEAKDLALVLRYGALPVVLEPQAAQIVSATVGDDALRAGVIAGLIGLALASLYMLVLYRLLGLVAIASLSHDARCWLYAIVT